MKSRWHHYLRHAGHPYAVVAFVQSGDTLYSGCAIVSRPDQFDKTIGKDIAYGRADALRAGRAEMSRSQGLALTWGPVTSTDQQREAEEELLDEYSGHHAALKARQEG